MVPALHPQMRRTTDGRLGTVTTPGDVAGTATGYLVFAGLGWLWYRSRATRSRDSYTRAVYQRRGARLWINAVFGGMAAIAVVALVVAGIMAVT